jgi:hypothetical protein
MPLLCVECDDSRSALVALDETNSTIEGHWVVFGVDSDNAWDTTQGTMDDTLVRLQVDQFLPLTYLGLWFVDYRVEHKGNKVWDVTARYGVRPPKRPDSSGTVPGFDTPNDASALTVGTTIDCVATTTNVKKSLATPIIMRWNDAHATIPDHRQHINVDGDSVEGVDIYVPKFEFQETHYFTHAQFNPTYRRNLFNLQAKTNNAAFRGFEAGEVLFLGFTATLKGLTHWEVTFKFAASPNQKNLETKLPGTLVGVVPPDGVVKKGWQYLWIRYLTKQDGKVFLPKPQYLYIERVYEEANFAGLGIGTH